MYAMKPDDLFPEDGAEIRVRGYSNCVEAVYLSATGEAHGSETIMRKYGDIDDMDIVQRAMSGAAQDAGDASGESARRAQRMLNRWADEASNLGSARYAAAEADRRHAGRGGY